MQTDATTTNNTQQHATGCGNGRNMQEVYLAPVVQKVNSAIQWIVQLVSLIRIHWLVIVIYPMDSAIQLLNYWGLMDNAIQPLTTEAKLLPPCIKEIYPLMAILIMIDESADQDD